MTLDDYLKIPHLKALMKTVAAGTYLFKQGQLGRTMFIILSGVVELVGERDDAEHVAALLESGEFLGEKAILDETPHQRVFSARASSETIVLELSARDIEHLQEVEPRTMTDILKRVFRVTGERLSRSNYLVRILRSSDNSERMLQCIRYFCRTSGTKTKKGVEVRLTAESIHYYIDLDKRTIAKMIEAMVEEGVLMKLRDQHYLVPDENAILKFFETAKAA